MAKKTKNTAAAPVAGAAEVEAASGFSLAFINHILKPGSSANSTMQTMMNVLYTLLALVLAMLLFSDTSNIHYYAMIGLLVGLAASTNWFFTLLMEAKAEQAAQQEAEEAGVQPVTETKKDK